MTEKTESLIELGDEAQEEVDESSAQVAAASAAVRRAANELARASQTDSDGEPIGDVHGAEAKLARAQGLLAARQAVLDEAEEKLESVNSEKGAHIRKLESYTEAEERNLAQLKRLSTMAFSDNASKLYEGMASRIGAAQQSKSILEESLGTASVAHAVPDGQLGNSGIGYLNSSNFKYSNGGTTSSAPGSLVAGTSTGASHSGSSRSESSVNMVMQAGTNTNTHPKGYNDGKLVGNADSSTLEYMTEKQVYLDKIRKDAEYDLADKDNRSKDWDIVRGRLASEFVEQANGFSKAANKCIDEYNKLNDEYKLLNSEPDSQDKLEQIEKLVARGNELRKEIDSLSSKAKYASNMAIELSDGLNINSRTVYYGVGGRKFTDIHKSLIQKQGMANENYLGTCGLCAIANACILLGINKSEAEILNIAVKLGKCTNVSIASYIPNFIKNRIRANNGGTSQSEREYILNELGFQCEPKTNQSLQDIAEQIRTGHSAIITVEDAVLNKKNDVTSMNPTTVNHAITITGVEMSSSGDVVGVWVHDTGVISSMGNAFYCSAEDYEKWSKNPGSSVLYISRGE